MKLSRLTGSSRTSPCCGSSPIHGSNNFLGQGRPTEERKLRFRLFPQINQSDRTETGMEVKCSYCGRIFQVRPSRAKSATIFCNQECRNKFDKSKKCSVEGCDGRHYGCGLCHRHYQQLKKSGVIKQRTSRDKNEIRINSDYAELVLYNLKNEEVAVSKIDFDDIQYVYKHKWHLTRQGYVGSSGGILLHSFLFGGIMIDHVNRDRLDNRRENLRVVDCQRNAGNSEGGLNKTGFKGVYASRGKWKAEICSTFLGYFGCPQDAAREYDKAAMEWYGQYALTNRMLGRL